MGKYSTPFFLVKSCAYLFFSSILFVGFTSASESAFPKLGKDSLDDVVASLSIQQKVDLVLGTGMNIDDSGPAVGMTIEERVPGAAGNTYRIKENNIPSLVLADGPAGVRILPEREASPNKRYYGTAFPIASLLSSTWDVDLVQEVGLAMGEEAKEYGIDIMLSPALNIHRYALGGRNFEYYSEDPLISGKMAAALVRGMQSKGVGTSLKHYVANNHEWNRASIDVQVDERALREIYLRGFEIAIKESKPWTVMSSYNQVNGHAASENKRLLTDVLRNQWGFDGLVMTDWFGGTDAVKQMQAGNDLLMPGTDPQRQALLSALESGELEESTLDRNVKNILRVIEKSPVFNHYRYSEAPNLNKSAGVARSVAREGMVLLKNDTNVLPLKEGQSLAVFGNYSFDMVTGGTGSGDVNEAYVVSLEQGLDSAGFVTDKTLPPFYKKHIESEKEKLPPFASPIEAFFPKKPLPELEIERDLIDRLAKENNSALITIGRSSGEFEDRKTEDFYLSEQELSLINTVSEVFHSYDKPVIVVLNIGGVIEMASWIDKVDSILLAYQPGQEAGNAIADVLAGKVSPSGKLVDTFPIDLVDYSSHAGFPGRVLDENIKPQGLLGAVPSEVTYTDGIWVGYRYFNSSEVDVVFPFGFGLSYSEFKYGKLKLNDSKFDNNIEASITIKNTGNVPAKEIVQLYLSAPEGGLEKPSYELRAFAKTKTLAPGETQTLSFTLSARDLTSFDAKTDMWVAAKGKYKVLVGRSSRDIKQKKSFSLSKNIIIAP